jgi:hypothetical protein
MARRIVERDDHCTVRACPPALREWSKASVRVAASVREWDEEQVGMTSRNGEYCYDCYPEQRQWH